jgi:SPW repeat
MASQSTQGKGSKTPRRNSIIDTYTLAFAAFAFASPWLFGYAGEAARIDLWASSAVVAAFSVAAIVAFAEWQEWLTLLLGIWLAVGPWLLGFADSRAMHMCVGAGSIVAYLAAFQLWLAHYGDSVLPQGGKPQTR